MQAHDMYIMHACSYSKVTYADIHSVVVCAHTWSVLYTQQINRGLQYNIYTRKRQQEVCVCVQSVVESGFTLTHTYVYLVTPGLL